MISRHKLLARHCVRDLVRVVDEVGPTITAPTLIPFDMPMVALLLLSKILRDERTFVLICLEEMGVDMRGLTSDVDALINQKNAEGRDAGLPEFSSRSVLYAMDPFVEEWLDRAGREACRLGHRYLSVEHLLLAIVVDAEEPLGAVLSRHGLDHVRLREAILAARTRVPHPEVPEILVSHSEVPGILDTSRPFGAGWDTPATGVPRRYSMAMILGMMAVYAVLFAALRLLGTMTEIFFVVTVLFTGVALGQPILYGGRYPRAASIWIGAVLFPVEILVWYFHVGVSKGRSVSVTQDLDLFFLCVPLGALFGYLAGCLAAGMFCALDWYQRRKQSRSPPAEPAVFDPFQKDDAG